MQRFDFDESLRSSRYLRNKKLILIGGIACLSALVIVGIVLIVLLTPSKKDSSNTTTTSSLNLETTSIENTIKTTEAFTFSPSDSTDDDESTLTTTSFVETVETNTSPELISNNVNEQITEQPNENETLTDVTTANSIEITTQTTEYVTNVESTVNLETTEKMETTLSSEPIKTDDEIETTEQATMETAAMENATTVTIE
jgi:hypothetical protein